MNVPRVVPPAAHGGSAVAGDPPTPVRADFSVSLNAYGAAPTVRRALREAARGRAWETYPEPTAYAARSVAARRWGCLPENLTAGAGAAELIHALSAAMLRPGDAVLVPRHGFAEYARAAAIHGARVVRVGRADDSLTGLGKGAPLGPWLSAVRRLCPRLVYVCSPGNPAGRVWSHDELITLADATVTAGALLVLDQAYDDFTTDPMGRPALPLHPGVLHLHSLTKGHALAGVRVGLAHGTPAVINAIDAVRPPWPVSSIAQTAIVAAFSDAALAHVHRTTRRLRRHGAALAEGLAELGIRTAPTATHILLGEVRDAAAVRAALLASHGVRVRDCSSFGLPHHIRVAARTPGDNTLLVAALAALARRGMCFSSSH
ncbi:MAG: putative aminotransferase [Gemmatimonadetes bacterium]|nr:putative aminotransferase [Gemmatimonadota bacterium]